MARLAEELGWTARHFENLAEEKKGVFRSNWVLLTSRPEIFELAELREGGTPLLPASVRLWTDDYSAVFEVVKWGLK
jgi:hypothetical protein